MTRATPLGHPTLGAICVMCLRPFSDAPRMPLSKKERRLKGQRIKPPDGVELTAEQVVRAIRHLGFIPKWMRDEIERQRVPQPRPKPAKPQSQGDGTSKGAMRKSRRRRQVYERDGHQCVTCGWKPGEASPGRKKGERRRFLTIDHKTPLCRGGGNGLDNLQTMCNVCNGLKGAKTQSEFDHWLVTRSQRDREASIRYREQHGQRPRKEVENLGDHYGGGVAARGKGANAVAA